MRPFFPPGIPDPLPPVVTGQYCLHKSQLQKFLVFVALACSIRVTSAITWAFLVPLLMLQLRGNAALLRMFIIDSVATIYVHTRLFSVSLTYETDV